MNSLNSLKINKIWYAAYGTNLNKDRFLCYINGGIPEGTHSFDIGCRDKTFPLDGGEFQSHISYISHNNTDVLVSKLNPWFSRVIYSTDENNTIWSTEFVVWRTKTIPIKNYLYMIARDVSFRTYCTQSATGTSNSHTRVNPTVMMKYRIVYDEKIAEQFGVILGSTIKTYANNRIENKISFLISEIGFYR